MIVNMIRINSAYNKKRVINQQYLQLIMLSSHISGPVFFSLYLTCRSPSGWSIPKP